MHVPADDASRLDELEGLSPFPFPSAWRGLLADSYRTGHRAYHTLGHVVAVLRAFEAAKLEVQVRDEASVYVAILFHDAVYAGAPGEDERASAELAREAIVTSGAPCDATRVTELILATANHGKLAHVEDADLALFLDCDLAILGASPEDYDRYERGIAEEYARVVDPESYRAGRARFLEAFLQKPRFFFTERFHRLFDARARENLARALEALR
jgi:predicted metal-dependent HD superfamily phosphohydrolase